MDASNQLHAGADLHPGKESSATIVWSAAWSSAPFRTLCDVLRGPQCRSGLCVACCLVLSAVPDYVWRTAWSSAPFRTLHDVLLGPQCCSGRCVTCCLVLSAVPDAAWCAAWSSVPFRTLCDVLLDPQCRSGRCVTCCLVLSAVPDADADLRFRRRASRTTGLRYECVWIVATTILAPHEVGYFEFWLYCCHKLAGTLQRPAC